MYGNKWQATKSNSFYAESEAQDRVCRKEVDCFLVKVGLKWECTVTMVVKYIHRWCYKMMTPRILVRGVVLKDDESYRVGAVTFSLSQ